VRGFRLVQSEGPAPQISLISSRAHASNQDVRVQGASSRRLDGHLQACALLLALRGTTDEAEGVYDGGGGEKDEEKEGDGYRD